MMRGPSYDDNYISRKMTSMQSSPTFVPPSCSPGYLQPWYRRGYHRLYFPRPGVITEVWYLPRSSDRLRFLRDWRTTHPHIPYLGYSHVAPPPRMPPRMAPPPYYDDYYGYGGYAPYGGYGGYGYGGYGAYVPPPLPRYSRYDPYLDDDYDLSYVPRYRPTRVMDAIADVEKDKLGGDGDSGVVATRKSKPLPRLRALEPPQKTETEGDRHLARMSHKYPSLSEPQMLQDQVDKMRVRLKSMAFSLDPSGPVPEIVVPERSRRVDAQDVKKKYSSALEMEELPRLSTRRHHYYPEDEHMKDNLRIKCLSHYKTTRTQAEYWKPKGYYGDEVSTYSLPNYTSRYASAKTDSAKWEEPDKVYATSSTTERKPYSKTADIEDDDSKKERRKKKKSKERDEVPAIESASATSEPASAAPATAPEPAPAAPAEVTEAQVSSAAETPAAPAPAEPESEMDEKERKRLEKKKRKAEREAAAKAAMEAELAALAAAEAELARLEAESATIKTTESKPAESQDSEKK